MKTVAPHASFVQLDRQREHLRQLRLGAMKRRVEASHLWQIGLLGHQQLDRCQVVRLVQRRQGYELLQVADNHRIQPRRRRIQQPPVHHPVTDTHQAMPARVGAQKPGQVANRPLMAQHLAVGPELFADDRAVRVHRLEVGRRVKAFELTAGM